MSCSACGALPARVVANTGRDQYLPPEANALESLELDRSLDLRRCRACRALFLWGDHPQFYGSGNLDEETLDRLTPEQTATVELLLEGGLGPEVNTLVNAAFTQLEEDLVKLLLRHLAASRPDQLARLIPQFVARLERGPNMQLFSLVESYSKRDRRCAQQVVDLLRRCRPEGSVKYLLERCEAHLR